MVKSKSVTDHGDPLLVVAASQGKHIKKNFRKKIVNLHVVQMAFEIELNFPFYSLDFRSEKAVELLIKNGTNVNVANKYGTTALMAAAKKGNSENCCKQIIAGFFSSNLDLLTQETR